LKVKIYNLLNYKKHKYRQKSVVEKWYILTNLSSTEKIKRIYSNPMSVHGKNHNPETIAILWVGVAKFHTEKVWENQIIASIVRSNY
jgi:hypothetical protein